MAMIIMSIRVKAGRQGGSVVGGVGRVWVCGMRAT